MKVVYEDLSMVALTAPYIPGFLAFREADFLVEKVEKLRQLNPQMVPQVIKDLTCRLRRKCSKIE